MARLTIGQKAERVLKLLMGLRNARIAAALQAHGFSEQDLREGWQRLSALTRTRLDVRIPGEDPAAIAALDAFENTWFPVVRFTLARHHPEIAEHVFLNLVQTEGLEVAVSVATFIDRIAALEHADGLFGEEGPKARALLARRGLTKERVNEARALLNRLGSIAVEPAPQPTPEEQAAAEAALWAWYLEWGGIARVAISDRRLLRNLGFLRPHRSREEDGAEDDLADLGDDADADGGAATPLAPANGGTTSTPSVVIGGAD